MNIAQLIARESIRELVARYNFHGDAGRTRDVAALFAPHGSLELIDRGLSRSATGLVAIENLLDDVKNLWLAETGKPQRVYHAVATHTLDVLSETTARGNAYVSVIRGSGLAEWGRYVDRYVLEGDDWLFDSRRAFRDAVREK